MAIQFQTSPGAITGTKSTAGTTFTIALGSTAGDCVVVAICNNSSTITVTGITDGGSNTYHKVGSIVSGTITVELWKTDKANPAASGTLTVTVSATGSVADGVAGSYRGVAFGGEAAATNSASSTTGSSGARTLRETLGTGEVVTAFGKVGTGVYTVSTGHLRGQVGATTIRAALMDSEGNTSPVTNSATFTSGAWGAVSLELRPLTVAETVTMSDAKLAGYGNSIPDVMELLDADSTNQLAGKQNIDYNGWAHWNDGLRVQFFVTLAAVNTSSQFRFSLSDGNERTKVLSVSGNPSVTLTETLVWQDGTPVETLQLGLGLACPHLGQNWLDATVEQLGLAKSLVESLTMSDALGAGYGSSTSDQIVIVDSLGAGYGAALSDNDTFWLDAVSEDLTSSTLVLTLTLSDTESANWLDLVLAGYGAHASDQIVTVDTLGAGYGALASDQIVFSDGTPNVTTELLLGIACPHLGDNWLDSVQESFGTGGLSVTATDDLNNWQDVLAAGYGNTLVEQFQFTDQAGLGYGAAINDDLSSWVDADIVNLGMLVSFADALNTWLDTLGAGYGSGVFDQLALSDILSAGYGNATSDQIVIVDSLGAGYGAVLSDQMLLSDIAGLGYGFGLTDGLDTWLDSVVDILSFGISLSDTESANWLEFTAAGYGNATSDQIVITDFIGAGYGFRLSDNSDFWNDELVIFTNQPGLQLTLSDDNQNNWLDAAFIGYGYQTSDQIVIADSLGAGYGAALSDSSNFWLDSDGNVFGYAKTAGDQLTTVDALSAGYGNAASDQIIIVDSLGVGYGAQLSDTLNSWLDDVLESLTGNNIDLHLSDSLNNWLDALFIGYGAATSDQIVIVDSLGAGYGLLTSDNLNFWADQFSVGSVLSIALSDSLNFWLDQLASLQGVGLVLSDSVLLSDSLGMGYGYAPSDQLPMQDILAAGYGFILDDSIDHWLDFFTTTGIFPYTLDLSETIDFWDDLIAEFNATNTGPAVIRSLAISNVGSTSYVTVADQCAMITVKVYVDPLTITGYGSAVTDAVSNAWFDQLGISVSAASDIGLALSDAGGAAWLDDAAADTALSGLVTLDLSDSLPYQDGLGIGHGWHIVETGQMSDSVLVIDPGTTQVLQLADSAANWLDTIAEQLVLLKSVGDSANSWSDSVAEQVIGALISLQLGDALSWSDALARQLGFRKAISDAGAATTDGLSHSLVATAITMQVGESLNNWLDYMPGFTQDYGAAITENMSSNWLDVVTKTLS